jgi:hypothetical protein
MPNATRDAKKIIEQDAVFSFQIGRTTGLNEQRRGVKPARIQHDYKLYN